LQVGGDGLQGAAGCAFGDDATGDLNGQ